jgi:hypothetical protein
VLGSNDVEGVLPSSLKSMSQARLAYSFSSEVSIWFIDISSEETSSSTSFFSSSSSSSVSSSVELESSSSPPSSLEGHSLFLIVEDSASSSSNLCLPLLLDAILWRKESLERERVIGWMTREPSTALPFIAVVGAYSRRCLDHGERRFKFTVAMGHFIPIVTLSD